MRKAELIDAILAAATGESAAPSANGAPTPTAGTSDGGDRRAPSDRRVRRSSRPTTRSRRSPPRRTRSRRRATTERRRGRRRAPCATGRSRPAPQDADDGDRATTAARPRSRPRHERRSPAAAGRRRQIDPEDERASYGDGNQHAPSPAPPAAVATASSERRAAAEHEPQGEPVEVQGLLELRDEGYGFLRTSGYLAGRNDVYVSASQVRRFALRKGDFVAGLVAPAGEQREVPGAAARRRRSTG